MGYAAAQELASRGARLVLWDLESDAVRGAAEVLSATGRRCYSLAVDVGHAEQVAEAMRRSLEYLGRIDGAFNNAGIGVQTTPFETLDEAAFDRIVAVNLKSVWLCMKHQVQHMRTAGGGSIVNNASVSGLVGLAGQAAYTATKHGVVGLTKAAAIEGAAGGIRVNAICPGAVRTPLLRHLEEAGITEAALAGMSPQARIAAPAEIAHAVAWLLSGQSSFVTGAALPIDGGWSAQ
jgi:NAD(P)-dependent dehydrogenase (short-subunit alcohol dehydrogenase family)